MLISQIIAVLINISLNYLLIPTMGVRGAALATVITQFLSLLLLNVFFKDGKEVFYLQLKGVSPIYLVRWAKKKI
jgi:PST family polysaccharide transporter